MEKVAFFLTKKLTDQKIRKILDKIPEKRQEDFYKEKPNKYFDLARNSVDDFVENLNEKIKTLQGHGKLFWSFLMDGRGSVRVWVS